MSELAEILRVMTQGDFLKELEKIPGRARTKDLAQFIAKVFRNQRRMAAPNDYDSAGISHKR